jgi:hypothetical protein
MEQGRRAATQDNGESQSGRRENIEVTKEDFGRYERNGSKAWCLAIDARLTEPDRPASIHAWPAAVVPALEARRGQPDVRIAEGG